MQIGLFRELDKAKSLYSYVIQFMIIYNLYMIFHIISYIIFKILKLLKPYVYIFWTSSPIYNNVIEEILYRIISKDKINHQKSFRMTSITWLDRNRSVTQTILVQFQRLHRMMTTGSATPILQIGFRFRQRPHAKD